MQRPAGKTDPRMWIASAGALTVEGASNALYAFSLGGLFHVTVYGYSAPVDGVLLAVGAVSLALFQSQLAEQVIHGRPGDPRWMPWLGTVAALLICMAYSMGAMSAHVLKLQRHLEDGRRDAHKEFFLAKDALKDATEKRDRIAADLERVKDARAIGTIKTDLENVSVEKWRFDRTAECTQPVKASDVSACAPFQALRVELAQAIQKEEFAAGMAKVEKEVEDARAALSRFKAPAEPSAVEKTLADFLAWALAVTIELAATFGFALARGPARAPGPAARTTPEPVTPPSGGGGKRRKVQAGDVFLLYQRIRDGIADVPGAKVDAAGWIAVSQSNVAEALGTSKTIVNARLKELEAANKLTKRKDGAAIAVRLAYAGPAVAAAP